MWVSVAAVLAFVTCLPNDSTAVALEPHGPVHPGPLPPAPQTPSPWGPRKTVPWQVMVMLFEEHGYYMGHGGGAILSDRWVLTSGRNLFIEKSHKDTRGQQHLVPKVYLRTAIPIPEASKEAAVERIFLHPGFQKTSDFENDLALIKLKEPLNFDQTLMPIPLPERGEDQEERAGEEAIFGAWDMGVVHNIPSAVKYLKLPVVSRAVCHAEYQAGGGPIVNANMFCTTFRNTYLVGEGNSLVFQNPKTKRAYLAGINSFDNVNKLNNYAVHTRISTYLPWIRDVMREDEAVSAQRESLVADLYSG
ncbi:mannan-binding lectin serine protease 2-like [Sardina pilchardus]|uniref:mannan-binding lectin serine protease 2-like n=1 Tax=Sardina pilchardus TaxID=27697 RepID=UPI002E12ABC3